jgi:hypothetical protein
VRQAWRRQPKWLTVAKIEDLKEWARLGLENAQRSRPKDEEALKDEQIKKLKQEINELVIDSDIFKAAWYNQKRSRQTSG